MGLILKDMSVSINKKQILKSIDLKVEKGEFISLIGSSGCGKTTLLKTIAGIIPQDRGEIFLNENLIDNLPPHKRNTVILFQDFRLFPNMTVGENIEFPMKIKGIKKKERREKSIELLEKVQLSDFHRRKITEISGGQMQRVALARALAANPTVLLLDEPFSNLDVNLRKDMRELVLKLQAEYKITTILVTHDQDEALSMSNRIAFMSEGRILQYDSPEIIFENPKDEVIANYFSSGYYMCGKVQNNIFESDFLRLPIEKEDGNYRCLIRPASIKLHQNSSGEFQIETMSYKGDSLLIKIRSLENDFYLETFIYDKFELSPGQNVDVELNSNKLVFFKLD